MDRNRESLMSFSEHGLPFKVLNTVLRGVRSTIENSTHGVLSVLNIGCRKSVPPAESELLFLSATTLAERIRKKEILSVDVVKAYIHRIGQVNDILNAVVEGRYAEALQEAALADQFVLSGIMSEAEIADRMPLLGVPFTSKEALLVKGLPSSCGLICRKGLVADEDCEAVERLRNSGAIPIAVSNTSEICMWWESYNNLHGRTSNPYDTTRTVGGSSGGEAAILSSAGSVIGLGTDLGGSIRLPAHFTGIFGHKPSPGLVPTGGQFPPVLVEISPYVAIGPMVRYATDLKLVLSALIGKEKTQSIQLFTPVEMRSLKVYYMMDDGGSPGTAPVAFEIKSAMKNAIRFLSLEGSPVQSVNLRYLKIGFMIWTSYLAQVEDQSISNIMKGGQVKAEEPSPSEMLRWLVGKSEHTFPVILNAWLQDNMISVFRKPLEQLVKCGDILKAEFLSLLEQQPSVFLYPTFPHAASHHGEILANPINVGYSVIFNGIGLPVTQCPIGVTESGLPFGMQIVTAPGNDRYSIAVAEFLEKKLGGWSPPLCFDAHD